MHHRLPSLIFLALLYGSIGHAADAPQAALDAKHRAFFKDNCLSCHNAQVQMKNVRLDSPQQIKQHAQNVYQQVAVTKQMPMGNANGMTEEERAMIGRWFVAGAKLE